jgi:rhomboid-like protein
MLFRNVGVCFPRCIARPTRFTPQRQLHFSRIFQQRVPSFRSQVIDAVSPIKTFKAEYASGPTIRRQVAFAIAGSVAVYYWAAVWTTIDTEVWTENLKRSSSIWTFRDPTSDEIRRANNFALGKKLQTGLSDLKAWLDNTGVPAYFKYWIIRGYVDVAQPYLDTTEGRRLCWKISLFNIGVYLAWKIRALEGPMMRAWTHNPLSGRAFTLITCVFSHKSLIHLLFNCMALTSFGSAATRYFQNAQEQGPSPLQESSAAHHFLGFYISAGLFSSLVSHIASARLRFPRMVAQMSTQASSSIQKPIANQTFSAALASSTAGKTTTSAASAAASQTPTILPSLGASGAVYASVMVTALAFPDAQIALAIPPSFPIPIQWGVGGMVALDMIGVLRGWRMFDHYAHLGGAAFGALYWKYGPVAWDYVRESVANASSSAREQKSR